MSDRDRLAGYVALWWEAVQSFLALVEELPPELWDAPTDLPGWDVRACVSHTTHLEAVLASGVEETAEVGEPAHVTGLMGLYTEIGVVNRRDRPPAAVVAELREVATRRHDRLLADPPADAGATAEPVFGGVPWTWETLLRNRPLDVWMHEQDVRRAVGRAGGLDTAPARHTAEYLAEGLGYVLAKRVRATAGSTLVLAMGGSEPFAFTVGDDGRGRRLPAAPAQPDVTLHCDREAFVVLAGGRRRPADVAVRIDGDVDLGRRVLEQIATTP